MLLRVSPLDELGATWVAPWRTDPHASNRRLRGEILVAVRRHRYQAQAAGLGTGALTVEFAPADGSRWWPVMASGTQTPVVLGCPFGTDWTEIILRLRLAHRHCETRRRLRARTRARQERGPD